MSDGLRPSDIQYLVTIFKGFPEIEKAILFGSRAKGTHKPGSDVDIAVLGDKIDFDAIARLHTMLEEESPMPYFFDILDYSHTPHADIRAHVDRVGIVIYERG